MPYDEVESAFYIRISSDDDAFAKGEVSALFAGASFLSRTAKPESELAFVTEPLSGGLLSEKLACLEAEGAQVLSVIRVADC